jgi:hypothetical protein
MKKRSQSDLQPSTKKLRDDKSSFELQLEKLHQMSDNVIGQNWENTWNRPIIKNISINIDLCFTI